MAPKRPNKSDFKEIAEELFQRRFVHGVGLQFFRQQSLDERVYPGRLRSGRESGFRFQYRNLAVVVWTTWLNDLDRAREKDSGWVVIEQDGRAVYFVPVSRTAKFKDRLLMEAKIARLRIKSRPNCPDCQEPMRIVMGRGLGSRFWKCPKGHARASWDSDDMLSKLPVEARKYLLKRRKARLRYYRRLRKLGKPIRTAMLKRKGWKRAPLPPIDF